MLVLMVSSASVIVPDRVVEPAMTADRTANRTRAYSSMRSGVDVQTRPLETFTDPQAKQIVSRLTDGR